MISDVETKPYQLNADVIVSIILIAIVITVLVFFRA